MRPSPHSSIYTTCLIGLGPVTLNDFHTLNLTTGQNFLPEPVGNVDLENPIYLLRNN